MHSATCIKADGSNDAIDLGEYSESEEDQPPCNLIDFITILQVFYQ